MGQLGGTFDRMTFRAKEEVDRVASRYRSRSARSTEVSVGLLVEPPSLSQPSVVRSTLIDRERDLEVMCVLCVVMSFVIVYLKE